MTSYQPGGGGGRGRSGNGPPSRNQNQNQNRPLFSNTPLLNGKVTQLVPSFSSGEESRRISKATTNTRDSGFFATTTTTTTTTAKSPPARQRPPGSRLQPDSELTTSFDPSKDRHLWTMWRVAVTGRIMDGVRRKENLSAQSPRTPQPLLQQQQQRGGRQEQGEDWQRYQYGPALVKTPLDRFIRVENGANNTLATLMMHPRGEGGSQLQTEQFVFYGVPRVVLRKPRRTTHLPGNPDQHEHQ
ncbi:uncharacterized protein LOC143280655 [Babylonia areolata]|uniref:uncharacterized protein LOC143280655 n=1 Tax=Babylonia areolata TaxID=304850 RepID=UPI003FD52C9B